MNGAVRVPVSIVPDAVPSGGANCNLSVQDAFAFTIFIEHLSRIVVKDESPLSASVPIVTGTVLLFLIAKPWRSWSFQPWSPRTSPIKAE